MPPTPTLNPPHSIKRKEKARKWWNKECHDATSTARKAYKIWRRTLNLADKTILNKMEAIKKGLYKK